MNETTRISTAPVMPFRGQGGQSFQTAREAKFRANVDQQSDPPETRAALHRLDKILSSGQPLRNDVPRGYYLNIQV